MGGGGFMMEPDNPALDRHVLALARCANPAICFLPTATGDSDSAIGMFYAAVAKHTCRPSHVTIFERTPDLKAALLSQDVIYVGGGNTKSMLAVWREWESRLLPPGLARGTVLAGERGAICWFEAGVPTLGAGWRSPCRACCRARAARTKAASGGRRSIGSSRTATCRMRWRSTTAPRRTSSGEN